ncbi:ABC transporter permease [Plantactinospora sp. S1510]|uniref:ABC transporter permease n=1 Tax=Plantactinospora alkalitolerans TaxID=2789879 RepID=A0ABS0H951_9ACTN|nr:FtsX-like permease family protein [Plantactinospora alkalitolerans]MBF9134998.1 ABC transporter permease [Plantactinospora alkalitolerans]
MSVFSLARLVTAGDRGARIRLAGMAAGVAVGVALLLLLWGAYDALASRAERSTWTTLSAGVSPQQVSDPAAAAPSDDTVLASSTPDYFMGRTITRIDVAASPGSTVAVPGVGRAPLAGTYYASPALAALIDAHPADELGARYGTRAGVIGHAGLASPDSLVVVTGTAAGDLNPSRGGSGADESQFGVWSVAGFGGAAYPNVAYRTVAIIGAIAILLPVLILVGVVTRLGAAERAERFATLRLIGATPRRVADIAAAETGVTSLAGAFAGALSAWLLSPIAARIEVGDGRFFRTDLTVAPFTVIAVVAGVVAVSTAVAWWRTAHAGIGPLGVSREQSERRPAAFAVVPLIAGTTLMLGVTLTSVLGSPLYGVEMLLVLGFLLISLGLVTSGPVLTYWVAHLAARGVRGTAGVIAMNRIRQHPRATFRAVSGLVAAVFMVSVFAAAVTTVTAQSAQADGSDRLAKSTVLAYLATRPTEADAAITQASRVAHTPGVTVAAIGHHHPEEGVVFAASDAARLGLPVPAGADHVQVASDYFEGGPPVVSATAAPDTAPAILLIATDGTASSTERARTAVLRSGVRLALPPATRTELAASALQTTANRYAGLTGLGMLVATIISAVSLAVSTTAAILDRKRVLGLLRLTGMPVSTLRRVILAETALPLATVFALCIGLGFLAAWCVVAGLTEGRRTVSWPDRSYFLALAASLLLAAAAVAGTFRTAHKNTEISVTRYE